MILAVLGLLGYKFDLPDRIKRKLEHSGQTGRQETGYRVVGVHDGDTITVYSGKGEQIKVRLFGIDAPELKQAFGAAAKQTLSAMVFERTVDLLVANKDRYGRTVATVTIGGRNVNLAMVRAGMAWHYVAYAKKEHELAEAEQEARAARRGLWADRSPVAPWVFRAGGKAKAAAK